MTPIVSIIIPTIGREGFLTAAIESAVIAARKVGIEGDSLEVIVIDDGEGGAAAEACKRVGTESRAQLRYVRSAKAPRGGAAAARNQGIRMATADAIYLLDDDDKFLPNRFETSLPLMRSGNFDVVLENALREYVDGSGRPAYVTGPEDPATNPFLMLISGNERSHVASGATAFTKEVFLRTGGYDETLHDGEDGEFLCSLALHGRVALVAGAPVTTISIHADNSSRPDRRAYWKNVKALARLHERMRGGTWPAEAAAVRDCICGKLDFALTQYRKLSPSYWSRLSGGAKALYYFPWDCMSINNAKSVVVWLVRRRES